MGRRGEDEDRDGQARFAGKEDEHEKATGFF
jgi:hypothetical protein